jgi:hypothetical protein
VTSVSTHLLGFLWLALSKLGGYKPDVRGLILDMRNLHGNYYVHVSLDFQLSGLLDLFPYGYGSRSVKLTILSSSPPRSRMCAYPPEY